MEPLAKRFEEMAMEVRYGIEETAPDGPGGLIWTFLVDFRKVGFAVAPKVDAVADARGKSVPGSIGHIRSSEDLKIAADSS